MKKLIALLIGIVGAILTALIVYIVMLIGWIISVFLLALGIGLIVYTGLIDTDKKGPD